MAETLASACLLGSVGANNMQQRRLVIGSEALVELAHKRGLVHESKAAQWVQVYEILINNAAQVAACWEVWREQPVRVSLWSSRTLGF